MESGKMVQRTYFQGRTRDTDIGNGHVNTMREV